jgi:Ca2+-binding RTX toxin-like protein
MKNFVVAVSLTLVGGLLASAASAATCTVADFTYQCDITCSASCGPFVYSACDGNADGKCVICGSSGQNLLYGSDGDDVICGKGGQDFIDSREATTGDIIDGGGGDDVILAGDGNNQIFGGGGDDYIAVEDGNNSVEGGTGDDEIHAGSDDLPIAGSRTTNLCGGKGNDVLTGWGHGHFCFDGGRDQSPSGFDCNYSSPIPPTSGDAGTARHCANVNFYPGVAGDDPCGCY